MQKVWGKVDFANISGAGRGWIREGGGEIGDK